MGFLKSLIGSIGGQSQPLGEVRGKHFTEWVEEVKQLKRDGKHQEVLDLCLLAVDAIEAESKADGLAVAPWWYDQAALAARRTNQPAIERAVMERYLAHPSIKNCLLYTSPSPRDRG